MHIQALLLEMGVWSDMNLTRISLVFILIVLPFMFVSYGDAWALQKREQVRQQSTLIINNACSDGTTTLKTTATRIDGEKQLMLNAQEVVHSFLTSYHYGFNALGKGDKIKLDQHLLALVVIGYDGFYVYGTKEVTEPSGQVVKRPILSEKIPYVHEDSEYLLKVTLDNYVTVLQKSTLKESRGDIGSVSMLPRGITPSDYKEIRQRIIRDRVTEALRQTTSVHSRYAADLGMSYDFYVPLGKGDSWSNALEDVGLMVFVQGYPLGNGQYLDMMTFNQGNILVQKRTTGYMDSSGEFYYCSDDCTHPKADPEIKVFANDEEAAMEGYYPCHMLNK